jgi:thiamine biosynthesis protein ThiS
MKITVNGKAMEMAEGITIKELLTQLAVRREYTAVARNREVVPKHSHAATVLREGDWVEIVHPMQGG